MKAPLSFRHGVQNEAFAESRTGSGQLYGVASHGL
jgi:hypothetical protein